VCRYVADGLLFVADEAKNLAQIGLDEYFGDRIHDASADENVGTHERRCRRTT